jgi:hypothetical protein
MAAGGSNIGYSKYCQSWQRRYAVHRTDAQAISF